MKYWILIFYPPRKPWEGKSVPKSQLGWLFLEFGKGKATKENSAIFWFDFKFFLGSGDGLTKVLPNILMFHPILQYSS